MIKCRLQEQKMKQKNQQAKEERVIMVLSAIAILIMAILTFLTGDC